MKKLFSIALAALLIFSILPQQQASASTFSDVPAHHGFYKEIMYLLNEGVISSAKKYGVNDKVSRAEVAVMISKAVQLNGEKTKTPFKDVPHSHAASGYINSAVNAGIIKGFTDGSFRPNGLVNRGELAIFLANAFVLQEESSTKFIDVSPSMASYSSIQKMVQARITNGYSDNTFRPTEKLTRGEISAFIARAMQANQKVVIVEKELKVHFIDVGQGDSILVQSPNGKNMLIDGGASSSGERVVEFLRSKGVQQLDYVVATNLDADHIGGLKSVLSSIKIYNFIGSNKIITMQSYSDINSLINAKNIDFIVPSTGDKITLDSAVDITVLNTGEGTWDSRKASIVLKITYGSISYLLTGDADTGAEREMMSKYNVKADVMKAGNHGSITSSSTEFINAVQPSATIFSYGKDNAYGNPDKDVIGRFKSVGSKLYITASYSDITFTTNGKTYSTGAMPWAGFAINNPPEPNKFIKIISKNLEMETVGIKNSGRTDVILTGWRLNSVQGNQSYTFPSFRLKAGETVYITSGLYAKDNGTTHLRWTTENMWNNTGDAAKLFDSKGILVHEMD